MAVHKQAKDAQETSTNFTNFFQTYSHLFQCKRRLYTMWAHLNLGILVNYMSATTRNFLSNLDKSFIERSASILSQLQDTHGISEEKIVHTETSKLQLDEETNFFIFCQAYPIPVAMSAYIT